MKPFAEMSEQELHEFFKALAEAVESRLPAGPSSHGHALFALLVFDETNEAQYVSNARREDIVQALREAADRLEQRQDKPRKGKR